MADEKLYASKKTEQQKSSKSIAQSITDRKNNARGEKKILRASSGNTLIDCVIGGSPNTFGIPFGTIFNLVGDSSTGKSFVANEFIAANIAKYGDRFKFVYDDCESGCTIIPEEVYGIAFDEYGEYVRSGTVEDAFVSISNFAKSLKKSEVGIYVVDSLDGLTSYEQNERADERVKAHAKGKTLDKGTYGMGKQKYLSQEFFPQLAPIIEDSNCLLIIVSQVRVNIAPFSFEKFTKSGGKALDFYSSSVAWLAKITSIKKRVHTAGTDSAKPLMEEVGAVVKFKETKSRHSRPRRYCTVSMIFENGLDDVGSMVDYLFALRTDAGQLTPAANVIAWDGDSGSREANLKNLKEWLNEFNLYDAFIDDDSHDGKINKKNIISFIANNAAAKKEFAKEFGETYTRDDLIAKIENENLEDELRARVIVKWEAKEAELSSGRKKRYATQPREGVTDED